MTTSVNVNMPNLTPNLSIIMPRIYMNKLPPISVKNTLGNENTLYIKLNYDIDMSNSNSI